MCEDFTFMIFCLRAPLFHRTNMIFIFIHGKLSATCQSPASNEKWCFCDRWQNENRYCRRGIFINSNFLSSNRNVQREKFWLNSPAITHLRGNLIPAHRNIWTTSLQKSACAVLSSYAVISQAHVQDALYAASKPSYTNLRVRTQFKGQFWLNNRFTPE